ncbi:MAG: helix-turn-helix domain-containing protein [Myxococcota bacterium]
MSSTAAERRRREKEARHEAILDAARQVLEGRGYRQLTMDHVASAAALSKGTLYLYFASKEELCAAIAERNIASVLPRLDAALATGGTGLAQVGSLMLAWSEHFAAHPAHFRFALDWMLASEAKSDEGPCFAAYRGRVNESLGRLIRALEAGKVDGSVRRDVESFPQALQLWLSNLGLFMARLQAPAMSRRLEHPIDMAALFPMHLTSSLRALASDPSAVDALVRELAAPPAAAE